MRTPDRRLRPVTGLLAGMLLLAGCAGSSVAPSLPSVAPSLPSAALPTQEQTSPTGVATASATPTFFDPIPTYNPEPTIPSWFNVEMTDVNSGKQFKISDFGGKVIVVDTMATWCPTCQGEMSQVQQLPGMVSNPDQLVRISLDVDPNEDATILQKYAAKNKFDWYIAIAPIEVGRFLSVNYDQSFLNPPLQPMLFIDKTGGVYGLPMGIKSAISISKTLAPYLAP